MNYNVVNTKGLFFMHTHKFIDSYMHFCEMLIEKSDLSKNVVVSPLSIYILLTILCESSNGKTKDEILELIVGKEQMKDTEFIQSLIEIIGEIYSSASSQCSMANALITKEEYVNAFNKEKLESLKKTFQLETFNGKDINTLINDWVSKKTIGLIPQIVDDHAKFDFALLNAIAFSGRWEERYRPKDIDEDGIFTNSNGFAEKVTMMSSEEHKGIIDQDVIGFTKPYKEGAFDFMALVPNKDEIPLLPEAEDMSLSPLLKKHIIEKLHVLYESKKEGKVFVTIPEYDFSYDVTLNDALQELGIHYIFSENADMSPLVNISESHVDEILHKATIKVDRNGTKAAAVTIAQACIGACPRFLDDDLVVDLDRPFIFSIMHKNTGIPVFIGIVNTIGKTIKYLENNLTYLRH